MTVALPSMSVVVPSFNHERFVDECLASVLDQRGVDVEIVVVDDGSTDGSVDRIRRWARQDRRLRLETQSNAGAHTALNRAIGLTRGEIVFVLNSDDAFEPDRMRIFGERFAADPGLTLLCSWIRVVDSSGTLLGVKEGSGNMPPWPRPGSGPGLSELGDLGLALLESNFVATTSNMAFRRSLFAEQGVRFLSLRYAHDWDFLLAATRDQGFEMIEEPLIRYRVHDTNTIAEGKDAEVGQGDMRFEVMWVVARHCYRVLHARRGQAIAARELRDRMWRSVPTFGCPSLFAQLLLLRGTSEQVPAAFDALVDPLHPFSRQARSLLASAES